MTPQAARGMTVRGVPVSERALDRPYVAVTMLSGYDVEIGVHDLDDLLRSMRSGFELWEGETVHGGRAMIRLEHVASVVEVTEAELDELRRERDDD